jgi:hypothetical protein
VSPVPWHVVADHSECGTGKFAVVKNATDEVVACHDTRKEADKHVAALYANTGDAVAAAQMSSASINDLPDSAFAYIEPGGKKDSEGKTVPRSLRHFPIHDEAHVRNALSRAPQSPFGEKAMPAIRRAAKKYGIRVAASAGADLLGVELARPGAWKLATGNTTFTDQMLRDAADFYTASGGQSVPVGLGHADDRFSGEPAFGSVTNLRYANDDRGPVLLGDIVDMPGWLSASAPRSWPNRSIEGWQNFEYDGREYSLVVTGLAFLGVTPPAVRNIRSLADLQTALAASAARHVVASAPADDPATPPKTPAPVAEEPFPTEGAGMSLAKYREALAGLPDDASEDDVKAALAAAGFTSQSPPSTQPAPTPEPAPEPAPEPKPQLVNASGTRHVDESAWQEREDRIKRLEAQAAKQRDAERDQIIAKAVVDGKFTPARKQHWVRLWDADPEGTRQVIDGLAKNVVPVMASGYDGGDGDEPDAYLALYGTKGGASRG